MTASALPRTTMETTATESTATESTATEPTTDCDVVVCGAGPTSSVLAMLLVRAGWDAQRIVVIDARPPEAGLSDTRPLALAAGSRATLQRLGAWDDALAAPIRRIHVSQRGNFGRTLIDCADYALPALGYVLPYGTVMRNLVAARTLHGIIARQPVMIEQVTEEQDALSVTLSDGHTLRTRYLVHAEGGLFKPGQQQESPNAHGRAGAPVTRERTRAYGQSALTAHVTCSRMQSDVAWERFTPGGPLALLPIRSVPTLNRPADFGHFEYGLVWCCAAEDAARRITLPDAAFLEELQHEFGERVGRFTAATPRELWPLGMRVMNQPAHGREFAIGNAAQTLHPVAGQGLNLGLRDAEVLARILIECGDDAARCVTGYCNARRLDRTLALTFTDVLPRLFASRLAPLVVGRSLALGALDLIAPARSILARQMMLGRR